MSISALSEECAELFNRRLVSATSARGERAAIENHLSKFYRWVKYNVVPSDKRDSLDCRLRKAVAQHSLIQVLLIRLREFLNQNSGMVEPTNQASYRQNPETVGGIMNRLFWNARAIHGSGITRSLVQVPIHYEYDEITGNNLTVKFWETILPYLNATLKDATQEMRERLSTTICLRQQNLTFLRSTSSRKVASRPIMQSALEATVPAPQESSKLRIAYSAQSCENTQRTLQADWIRTQGTRIVPSVRTATAVDIDQLPQMNTILEQKNTQNMAANVPRRPKVPVDQNEFECPYCFMVRPAEEYTKKNWPRHIIKDLAPFICILESCPTPDTMYESHADWISHIKNKHAHRGWVCYDDGHDSTQYFEDEQSFRHHVIEHRGSDVTDNQLAILTELYRGVLPFQLSKSCPFCNEYDDDASIDLDEHITLHLLYLSQVSIPGDFLDMQGVEVESEPDKSIGGTRLEGDKLSHKASLSLISSFELQRAEQAHHHQSTTPTF